jgi:hypothetical protein
MQREIIKLMSPVTGSEQLNRVIEKFIYSDHRTVIHIINGSSLLIYEK